MKDIQSRTKEARAAWYQKWKKNNPQKYQIMRRKGYERIKLRRKADPVYAQKQRDFVKKNYLKPETQVKIKIRKQSPKYKKQQRIYNRKNRLKQKDFILRQKYGITLEQYDEMVIKQNNVCAICGQYETHFNKWHYPYRRLSIDHNHSTKKIRGLLCHDCNVGIGHFRDNPLLLIKASEYLKSFL